MWYVVFTHLGYRENLLLHYYRYHMVGDSIFAFAFVDAHDDTGITN